MPGITQTTVRLCAVAIGAALLLKCSSCPAQDKEALAEAKNLLQELDSALRKMPERADVKTARNVAAGTGQPLIEPDELASKNGLLDTSMTVKYSMQKLWNMKKDKDGTQGRVVTVRLRSYNGGITGPTLRVRPGDVLRVHMMNDLPPNTPPPGGVNVPHGFNTTNLHTHGLHVSPSGNADNILVSIEPGQKFQNEIYIPKDHPPGTFWYHAHVHGSTAIQVSSGMTGALIVEGGLDDVKEIKSATERLFVLQQIPYIKAANGENYYEQEQYAGLFGPQDWKLGVGAAHDNPKAHGWRTTVNGQTQPSVHMESGKLQRWRFIQTGQREKVDLCLLPYDTAADLIQRNAPREAFLKSALPLYEVAADGLAFGFKWKRRHIDLFPGYRSDILVRVDKPGKYVLLDLTISPSFTIHQVEDSTKLLGVVNVSRRGGPPSPLPSDKTLAPLRPHADIPDAEVTEVDENGKSVLRVQRLKFQIDLNNGEFQAGDPGPNWDQPISPFGKNGVRKLQLGKADEWQLKAYIASHPYHIHVNPFEVLEHPWMTGEDVPRDESGKVRTIWRDTIIVPDGSQPAVGTDAMVRVRSRYERYIGRFVLHCHILDHEDQGMMQLVEIVGPGTGGHGAHGGH